MRIDTDKLREDLLNYFGTAMVDGNQFAIIELTKVQEAGSAKLISIAIENGFNLADYAV